MKIDQEYLNRFLDACEAAMGPTFDIRDLREAGLDYNDARFPLHLGYLVDQGFIERDDGDSGFGLLRGADNSAMWSVLPLRLTASGHKFIESLSSKRVSIGTQHDFRTDGAATLATSARTPVQGPDHSFKRHPLTADQRLWLAEVAKAGPVFSPRATRIALQGRISPGFSPDSIDPRLYSSRRLTPVGLWHVNSQDPKFLAIDRTIRAIRDRIIQKPDLKSIAAAEIVADTKLTETQVAEALFAVGEIGLRFFSKATGIAGNPVAYSSLDLPDEDSADDEYLNYTNIDDLLERFYRLRGRALEVATSYSGWQPGRTDVSDPNTAVTETENSMPNKRVFIVHGHNGEAKESVGRFIEKLGLEAIILHERPNRGRTIITKFQEESHGIGFAVVLMTPDDVGRAVHATEANSRARQNVVFELGFFIGKLGPERVAAIVKGDIEKPSDFDGVVYISLEASDWRVQLASELKAAGLAGDWSKVLP